MAPSGTGPPSVGLPRRLDRRLRLGPFPSARDALKFLTYAAIGAVLAPFAPPGLWLPVVGVGFLCAVWQPDGVPPDELVGRALAWRLRSMRRRGVALPDSWPPLSAGALVRLPSGRRAAVVRIYGTPLAYRPPAELERLFAQYGQLLRSLASPLAIRVGVAPLAVAPLLPRPLDPGRPDQAACGGYADLLTLLCRRRFRRRVDVGLLCPGDDAGAARATEQARRSLEDGVRALGLHVDRLQGPSLREAARGLGWGRRGGGA
jgi:hypothetical protein